ncbi:hypothetical protein QQ045_007635 [Rhodiola kirilowii]
MASTREDYVYMAKLAEQAERYDDMVEFMEKVVSSVDSEELSVEERNLLSVAYKNVIGALRASWRIISSIEQKEESRGNEDHVSSIRDYRAKIEKELSSICDGIQKLLDSKLIPSAGSGYSKVFYLEMKGDYHRYLAEFKTGAERKEAAESTLSAYKAAQDIANSDLAPSHPIRLGLALNFYGFYFETLNSPDRACSLVKQAFDEAVAEMDTICNEIIQEANHMIARMSGTDHEHERTCCNEIIQQAKHMIAVMNGPDYEHERTRCNEIIQQAKHLIAVMSGPDHEHDCNEIIQQAKHMIAVMSGPDHEHERTRCNEIIQKAKHMIVVMNGPDHEHKRTRSKPPSQALA